MSEYGHRLEFDPEGKATCPESGHQFLITPNGVIRN